MESTVDESEVMFNYCFLNESVLLHISLNLKLPFLDGKDDKQTLLAWHPEMQNDHIRCDGSRVIFDDKELGVYRL